MQPFLCPFTTTWSPFCRIPPTTLYRFLLRIIRKNIPFQSPSPHYWFFSHFRYPFHNSYTTTFVLMLVLCNFFSATFSCNKPWIFFYFFFPFLALVSSPPSSTSIWFLIPLLCVYINVRFLYYYFTQLYSFLVCSSLLFLLFLTVSLMFSRF